MMSIRIKKESVWTACRLVFPVVEFLLCFWMLGGFSLIVLVLPFEPVLLLLQPRTWMYPALAVVLTIHGGFYFVMKKEGEYKDVE